MSIVRVASNSPLQGQVNLGDTITKVNGYSVSKADDLLNIIMMSPKQVRFEVESNEKKNNFSVPIWNIIQMIKDLWFLERNL